MTVPELHTQPSRTAEVTGGLAVTLELVQRYLPSNYFAREEEVSTTDWEAAVTVHTKRILITGQDSHGWTLDGYVIPRLASGCIIAVEVDTRTPADTASEDDLAEVMGYEGQWPCKTCETHCDFGQRGDGEAVEDPSTGFIFCGDACFGTHLVKERNEHNGLVT